VHSFNDVQQLVALGTGKDASGNAKSAVRVMRNGELLDLELNPVLTCENGSYDKFRKIGILPKQELVVRSILNEADAAGKDIKIGDRILKVDGVDILNIHSLQETVSKCGSVKLDVLRGEQVITNEIRVVPMAVEKPYMALRFGDVAIDIIPFYPSDVDRRSISEVTSAKLMLFSAGKEDLRKYKLCNDLEIVKINGVDCNNLYDVVRLLNRRSENTLTVLKSGMSVDVAMPAASNVRLIPAVYTNVLGLGLETSVVILHRSPFQQIRETIAVTFQTLGGLLSKNSDISFKNLMGPTGLVRTLHTFSKTDFRLLLWFVVLININLAILNMLPLPVLDGGYIAISIIEKFTGRKCVGKIFGIFQSVFLFLLFGLLVYVSFFDIRRWVGDSRVHDEYSRQLRLGI
jgi:regulator of sigma E protease